MKKTIIILSLLFLAGCSSRRDVVIPYENGINEVNYAHHNETKALTVSLRWADDYCSYKGKDFVVVERAQVYKKGLLSEKADDHVNRSVKIADAMGHLPVFGDKVAEAIGGKTNEKLLFKCISRK